MEKFSILTKFDGYISKTDLTNTPESYLISGSQNMLLNDFEKWESRGGYSLFGASSTDRNKIKSERVWFTSTGTEIFLREANGVLEYYSSVSSAWETLLTGLSTTKPIRFAEIWNSTELIDIQLFVNHSSILYEWSGGMGTYASSTATTIVINETIGTSRFLTTGTRLIRVKDSGGTWREFTVSSQTGSTFTVAEDPTAYTFTAGAIVVQSVRSNATTPVSGFTNDTIKVLENQAYVGSDSSRRVYISKSTSYTDFTFSTPRIPTEGALITLDDYTTAFEVGSTAEGRETMVVFSGRDRIYRTEFILAAGSSTDRETVRVKPLMVASGQGALSQELVTKIKNAIVFVNNNNELVELGSVENFSNAQQNAISDPIRPDFLDADFTGGMVRFWRNSIYVTAPVTGKTFILALKVQADGSTKKFWHTPQILPFSVLSEYGGDLYGHSGGITETYLAFDGVDDNGLPIAFKAHFAYRNAGIREALKNFDQYYSELYLSSNAIVNHRILFEYKGAKTIKEYSYRGDETDFLFVPNVSASLGVNPLGTNPLGSTTTAPEVLNKYRRFKKVPPVDFFEVGIQYECDEQDAQFQILATGMNMKISANAPAKITS